MEILQDRCFSPTICASCRKQASPKAGEAPALEAVHSRLAPIIVTDKNTINTNNKHVFRSGNEITKMIYYQVCGTLIMVYVTYKRKTPRYVGLAKLYAAVVVHNFLSNRCQRTTGYVKLFIRCHCTNHSRMITEDSRRPITAPCFDLPN